MLDAEVCDDTVELLWREAEEVFDGDVVVLSPADFLVD